MAQSIKEQMEILKAYADGKPVYKREHFADIGERVTEENHQFNFEDSFYSLKPLDWCTGKEAIDAYTSFMHHGSEKDEAPPSFTATSKVKNRMSTQEREYVHYCMETYDTFSIFIAGADWVIRNKDSGIDYNKSLDAFRESYQKIQTDKREEERNALREY